LANSLRKEARSADSTHPNQTYVGHVLAMLSTMQDIYEVSVPISDYLLSPFSNVAVANDGRIGRADDIFGILP